MSKADKPGTPSNQHWQHRGDVLEQVDQGDPLGEDDGRDHRYVLTRGGEVLWRIQYLPADDTSSTTRGHEELAIEEVMDGAEINLRRELDQRRDAAAQLLEEQKKPVLSDSGMDDDQSTNQGSPYQPLQMNKRALEKRMCIDNL
jgi:hypothetical protein